MTLEEEEEEEERKILYQSWLVDNQVRETQINLKIRFEIAAVRWVGVKLPDAKEKWKKKKRRNFLAEGAKKI